MRFPYAIAPATILGPATQNGPQDSFYMEILCFYVNGNFWKEVFPNVLARFTPFQELYTHFYCEIGYFRARFALALNLSFAQIAVAANDVCTKRYRRDAPATILGPLPKMVHKIVFTWKFYAFMLTVIFGKKFPPTCLHVLPHFKNFTHLFIAKLATFVRIG